MADAALATQSRSATNVSRVERSYERGAVRAVRPVGATDAFHRNMNTFVPETSATQSIQEQPSGGGLLSNSVQMLLAETRTQEAGASFVAPSSVGRALNSYLATQTKIRETIRDSVAFGRTSERSQAATNTQLLNDSETNTSEAAVSSLLSAASA